MKNTWEFGLAPSPFKKVVSGEKTVEGRLSTGKFAKFCAGDIIQVRQDFYDEKGVLQDGTPNALTLQVIAIRQYKNFFELAKYEASNLGCAHMAPEAIAKSYEKYYSLEQQREYGVLAIEVNLLGVKTTSHHLF